MKERYLYYRLNGELLEKKIKMWRLVDSICNVKHSLEELERLQEQLAACQEDIEHYSNVNARILRLRN